MQNKKGVPEASKELRGLKPGKRPSGFSNAASAGGWIENGIVFILNLKS